MLDYIASNLGGLPMRAALMHTGAPRRADLLAERVRERFNPAEVIVTEFTSVMAVHTGPGFVGVAFYFDDD
jgi:fatty acid-binding protein DegV